MGHRYVPNFNPVSQPGTASFLIRREFSTLYFTEDTVYKMYEKDFGKRASIRELKWLQRFPSLRPRAVFAKDGSASLEGIAMKRLKLSDQLLTKLASKQINLDDLRHLFNCYSVWHTSLPRSKASSSFLLHEHMDNWRRLVHHLKSQKVLPSSANIILEYSHDCIAERWSEVIHSHPTMLTHGDLHVGNIFLIAKNSVIAIDPCPFSRGYRMPYFADYAMTYASLLLVEASAMADEWQKLMEKNLDVGEYEWLPYVLVKLLALIKANHQTCSFETSAQNIMDLCIRLQARCSTKR